MNLNSRSYSQEIRTSTGWEWRRGMEEGKDEGGDGTQHRKHMNFVFKGPPSYLSSTTQLISSKQTRNG